MRGVIRLCLSIVAVTLLAGCIALASMLTTDSGSQLLWSLLRLGVAGIESGEVHGNPADVMELTGLKYRSADLELGIDRVRLKIGPRALLRGEVLINDLNIGNVRLRMQERGKRNDTPDTTSAVLGIPLISSVSLPRFTLESLRIVPDGPLLRRLSASIRMWKDHAGAWNLESPMTVEVVAQGATATVAVSVQGTAARTEVNASATGAPGELELNLQVEDPFGQAEYAFHGTVRKFKPSVRVEQWPGLYDLNLHGRGSATGLEGELKLEQVESTAHFAIDRARVEFKLQPQTLQLKRIEVFNGQGLLVSGRLQTPIPDFSGLRGQLDLTRLNLHDFNPDLAKSSIGGRLLFTPEQTGSGPTLVNLALEDPEYGTLDGTISVGPERIGLRRLSLDTAAGGVEASGHVLLSAAQAFELSVRSRAFNPGQFYSRLDGRLGVDIDASGTRYPPAASARIRVLEGSRMASEPVYGSMDLVIDGQVPSVSGKGELGWGQSRISLRSDPQQVTVQMRQLSPGPLVEGFRGKFNGRLEYRHGGGAGNLDLALDSNQVVYGQYTASDISLRLNGDPRQPLKMPFVLKVAGMETDSGSISLEGFRLNGSAARHRLQTRIKTAGGDADIRISGEFLDPGYRGVLQSADLDLKDGGGPGRPLHLQLTGPVPLVQENTRFRVGPLTLQEKGGRGQARANMQLSLDWNAMQLRSSGEIRALDLGFAAQSPADPAFRGQLEAAWDFDYHNGQIPSGSYLQVMLSNVHARLPADSGRTSGMEIEQLQMRLLGRGDALQLELEVEHNPDNRLNADATILGIPGPEQLKDGTWNSLLQIQGNARLGLHDPGFLNSLVGGIRIDSGRLEAQLRFSGRLTDPDVRGLATLDGAVFSIVKTGVRAELPLARLKFDPKRIRLQPATLNTPGSGGSVVIAGWMERREGEGEVFEWTINGQRLEVVDTAELKLVVSPRVRVTGSLARLLVKGEVVVDQGLFRDAQSEGGVVLSADVKVAGGADGNSAMEKKRASGLRLDLDVRIPDSFQVRYQGADILLGGKLHITQSGAGVPIADGRLATVEEKLVRNTYRAYGQTLKIRRGTVLFARSPLNNPGLDILAVREVRVGEVGVRVIGTAMSPQVELQSEPPMRESEILSWLVLGRPSSEAGKGLGELLVAAGSEFTGGASMLDQAREQLGLDELSFDSEDGTTAGVVTLGKRISEDLYLNYQQGILEQGYKIKAIYRLTPSWSLIGESGAQSNALEVEWNRRF